MRWKTNAIVKKETTLKPFEIEFLLLAKEMALCFSLLCTRCAEANRYFQMKSQMESAGAAIPSSMPKWISSR